MANTKVGLFKVLKDLFTECGLWFWVITSFIAALCIIVQICCRPITNPLVFYDVMISVIPDLLGFIMTGYAIIYSVQEFVIKKLGEKANDNHVPFHVLSASFAIACLSLLITLILSSVLKISDSYECNICYYVTQFFAILSAMSVLNTIFHLYSMRTHIIPMDIK